MEALKVTCDVQSRETYTNLIPIQGDLKSLSKESYEKLKRSILKHGIHSPVFVWENEGKLNILDGHQRVRTYGQLEKEGFMIPPVPIIKIEATDIKKAKEILLTLVSQYGKIESEGLYEFALQGGFEFEDLKEYDLPNFDLGEFEDDFFKDPIEPVVGEIDFSKEIDEKNDYIVLLFNNKEEFKAACEKFKVAPVRCSLAANSNPNMEIVGVGRILDGQKTIQEFFK